MKIFVIPDIFRGEISETSFELLGQARKLKESSPCEIICFLVGRGVGDLKENFGACDRILILDHENLEGLSPSLYQEILYQNLKDRNPDLLLLPHTAFGMDLAGFLSSRLNLPLVCFCRSIIWEEGNLVASSMVYGGKVFADVKMRENRGVFLVLPGSFSGEMGRRQGVREVEELPFSPIPEKVKFERYLELTGEDIDITKEEIILSVGRGIRDQKNLPLVEELAGLLGGVLGSSRPVVDQGWLPATRQIGRSGKTVKPSLLFTLGISGAPEFVEGMKDSKLIIAVNTDPNAPIFQVAHYGFVGDMLDFIPAMISEVKKRRGG